MFVNTPLAHTLYARTPKWACIYTVRALRWAYRTCRTCFVCAAVLLRVAAETRLEWSRHLIDAALRGISAKQEVNNQATFVSARVCVCVFTTHTYTPTPTCMRLFLLPKHSSCVCEELLCIFYDMCTFSLSTASQKKTTKIQHKDHQCATRCAHHNAYTEGNHSHTRIYIYMCAGGFSFLLRVCARGNSTHN